MNAPDSVGVPPSVRVEAVQTTPRGSVPVTAYVSGRLPPVAAGSTAEAAEPVTQVRSGAASAASAGDESAVILIVNVAESTS